MYWQCSAARGNLPQRLVGALIIILIAEVVEPLLLGLAGGGRGTGGFLFEGAVQALVAAVLLGVARLDALQADVQLQPPHRQRGQPARPDPRSSRGNRMWGKGQLFFRAGQGMLDDLGAECRGGVGIG